MIKKKRISQPDLDDWLNYIKNPKDIYDKEPKEESNEKRKSIHICMYVLTTVRRSRVYKISHISQD